MEDCYIWCRARWVSQPPCSQWGLGNQFKAVICEQQLWPLEPPMSNDINTQRNRDHHSGKMAEPQASQPFTACGLVTFLILPISCSTKVNFPNTVPPPLFSLRFHFIKRLKCGKLSGAPDSTVQTIILIYIHQPKCYFNSLTLFQIPVNKNPVCQADGIQSRVQKAGDWGRRILSSRLA